MLNNCKLMKTNQKIRRKEGENQKERTNQIRRAGWKEKKFGGDLGFGIRDDFLMCSTADHMKGCAVAPVAGCALVGRKIAGKIFRRINLGQARN